MAHPGLRVLVVEDNEVNLLLMESILKVNGCEIVTATTSRDGIESALREKPDLIFMDIQLPDGDGLDAVTQIRSDLGSEIPIAVVTAHAFTEYRTRATKASCQYFITKPLSLPAIEAVLKEVSEKRVH